LGCFGLESKLPIKCPRNVFIIHFFAIFQLIKGCICSSNIISPPETLETLNGAVQYLKKSGHLRSVFFKIKELHISQNQQIANFVFYLLLAVTLCQLFAKVEWLPEILW
jgi:hypothetical protein